MMVGFRYAAVLACQKPHPEIDTQGDILDIHPVYCMTGYHGPLQSEGSL